MNLDTLLANVGPTDIRLIAIALFMIAALFTYMARSSDESMNRTTYVVALIGTFVGLYILMEALYLLGRLEGLSEKTGERPTLPLHVIIAAIVMVGAAFVVALGAVLASTNTSLLISGIVVQGGIGLFAATVNGLAWSMTENGGYESIAGFLTFVWEYSRYFVFVTGILGLALSGIAGVLSAYHTVKTKKVVAQHRLAH